MNKACAFFYIFLHCVLINELQFCSALKKNEELHFATDYFTDHPQWKHGNTDRVEGEANAGKKEGIREGIREEIREGKREGIREGIREGKREGAENKTVEIHSIDSMKSIVNTASSPGVKQNKEPIQTEKKEPLEKAKNRLHIFPSKETAKKNEENKNPNENFSIIQELQKTEKRYKKKTTEDELKLLEKNSLKLLNEIKESLASINNIEEKSSQLKNIKNELVHDVSNLNKTLMEEIKNLNEIKKLQANQNALFSESLSYYYYHQPMNKSSLETMNSPDMNNNLNVKKNEGDNLHERNERNEQKEKTEKKEKKESLFWEAERDDNTVGSFGSFANLVNANYFVVFLIATAAFASI